GYRVSGKFRPFSANFPGTTVKILWCRGAPYPASSVGRGLISYIPATCWDCDCNYVAGFVDMQKPKLVPHTTLRPKRHFVVAFKRFICFSGSAHKVRNSGAFCSRSLIFQDPAAPAYTCHTRCFACRPGKRGRAGGAGILI